MTRNEVGAGDEPKKKEAAREGTSVWLEDRKRKDWCNSSPKEIIGDDRDDRDNDHDGMMMATIRMMMIL